ncbi:hypothetical protein DN536_34090, partial [Burkholderia multivorans]
AFIPRTATALGLPGGLVRELGDAPRTELALAWRKDEDSAAIARMSDIIAEVVADVIDDPASAEEASA